MEQKTKIQECILNIDMTCRSMYLAYEDVKRFKIPVNSAIYGDMIRYSYIHMCSIQDEFEILNSLAKDDIYLRDTLSVISPALKALRKYTGIRKARNVLFAHFHRDKNDDFHPFWIGMKDLKLPRTFREINQIYTWLHIINGIVVTRYYEELRAISAIADIEVEKYFSWVKEQEEMAMKEPTPFDTVYDEIEKRMKELGIDGINIDPVMTKLTEELRKKK